MRPRPAPFLIACLTTLCGCVPLLAQGRGYHMELSDGSSGWAILVNDSQKTIEAYHFSAKCRSAGRMKSATEYSYDALDSGGTSRSGPPTGAVAGIHTTRDVAERGTRMVSMENLLPQPDGCVWDAGFDAVIYADGSYEGDEIRVRGLQARRDGVAECVKYWANRLAQEAVDRASLETIRADAERLTEEDRKETISRCSKLPLACEYWRGRSQVDTTVAHDTRPWKDGPYIEGYGGIIQKYARHEKKVEADVALKRLDVVFPLPEALAEQGTQSRIQ
jgi:hypothetical protein